ncbi:MAG: hypothetical protein EOM51_11845 [Clostridia bacterium]|nr:hypothetical protein [Clostridia bacterium]
MTDKVSVSRSILFFGCSAAVWAVVRVLSFLLVVSLFSLIEHLGPSGIVDYLMRITHGGFNLFPVILECIVSLEASRAICSRIFCKVELPFYCSFKVFLTVYVVALPVLLALSFLLRGFEFGLSCVLDYLMAFFAWLAVSANVRKRIKRLSDAATPPAASSGAE